MKKRMIALGAFALVAAGAAFVFAQNNKPDPKSLIARNIEALGQWEYILEDRPWWPDEEEEKGETWVDCYHLNVSYPGVSKRRKCSDSECGEDYGDGFVAGKCLI
jgi:hypothetical protein